MKSDEPKPILCGTDFSEGAAKSAAVADALPRRLGVPGVGCLLHVAGRGAPRAELEERLRALIPAGAEDRGVATELRIVEEDDAARAICEAAGRLSPPGLRRAPASRLSLTSIPLHHSHTP